MIMSVFDPLRSLGGRAKLRRMFEALAPHLNKTPHRLLDPSPRKPFRQEGSCRDEVMLVCSGLLAKYRSNGSGRTKIVSLHYPGEWILPPDGRALYGIDAVLLSKVMVFDRKHFEPIVAADQELQHVVWKALKRDLGIGYEWLLNCGRRDSVARVAHLFCETAVRMGAGRKTVEFPFNQQQIADITGQTAINVNRVLRQLEREGLIERNARVVQFLDWRRLSRLAGFDASYLAM